MPKHQRRTSQVQEKPKAPTISPWPATGSKGVDDYRVSEYIQLRLQLMLENKANIDVNTGKNARTLLDHLIIAKGYTEQTVAEVLQLSLPELVSVRFGADLTTGQYKRLVELYKRSCVTEP